ncbi:MAG: hypothetical protein M0P14_05530 [Alkaliphilus sp.]|nr:hypothetical protein [Alkaliphilus sp.]
MDRRIMKGIITGGVVGMTVAMYAMGKKFQGKKMMKSKNRVLKRALAVAKGFNIF